MANQTRITVPVSIKGAERIFMQAIIEQLDIAIGARGGDGYVAQSELTAAKTSLNSALESVVSDLSTSVLELAKTIASLTDEVEDALDRELELYWLKGWDLKFIGRATNGPVTFTANYNIASGERLSVGLYEFTLAKTSMYSTTILDSVGPLLAAEYTTTPFKLAFARTAAGIFQLTVTDNTHALIDPVVANDLAICAGLVNKEGVFP